MADEVRPIGESIQSIVMDHHILEALDGSGTVSSAYQEKPLRGEGGGFIDTSEARRVEKLVARVAKVIRSYRLRAQAQRYPAQWVTKAAIKAERGRPASELAFIYGWDEDEVAVLMRECNLDPSTGEKIGD